MKELMIIDVKKDNFKEVLKTLETKGVKWASGARPTEKCIFDPVYVVGAFGDNALTYGGLPYSLSIPTITAKEFLKEFGENKITITRKGNKVTATDRKGSHASARCCPDDEFDFYTGAKLALERLEEKTRKIKEGDVVRVKDSGASFPTLSATYFATDDELRRYVYGKAPLEGNTYKVKRVGDDGKLYIDGGFAHSGLYVIGPKGVVRV